MLLISSRTLIVYGMIKISFFKDPSDNSISCIKSVYQGLDDRCLKVAWSDGTASRFPFNFLRDNCKCPECFESSSKQKLFNTARDLMMNIQAEEAVISEDGQSLKCVWPGGHESKYSLHWLYRMRMPEENEFRQRNSGSLVKDELILWNREIMQDKIPFYDYDALMSEDKSLFDFLYGLYQHGVVVVDNAPTRDGVVLELSARVGYHKRTHYG
jgi:gamma-butyrobetaine dioxygenase